MGGFSIFTFILKIWTIIVFVNRSHIHVPQLKLLLYTTLFTSNEHALNKIICTQSLLRVIDHATQSSGQSIKGGALGGIPLSCTQTWRPNSNFETDPALTQHSIVYYWHHVMDFEPGLCVHVHCTCCVCI